MLGGNLSPPQTPFRGGLPKGRGNGPLGLPLPGEGGQLPPIRLQQRNDKGGIIIYDEEIKDAFTLLAGEGKETLTREDLTSFLDTFFPGMLTHKEVKSMLGPSGISFEKLKKLVQSNDLQDFDPIAEAFKVLDPDSKGEMDMDILKQLLEKMPGIGEIDKDDSDFLMKYLDKDNDGRVGLEDFANIGDYPNRKAEDAKNGGGSRPF
eukprot:CAMPEP_0197851604 /NCGR_PEP_ID=MMETSP1438-20131217/18440_1 /TAXON_ID=1461541 /ORGANISM="Pterosperma sp., Strain CCMP1384" /LENGTH=205 /DNA_ID=CAMNT_0043465263 /DNA_START=219 /DNA_END=836 /DNA_ORIENTATION=+